MTIPARRLTATDAYRQAVEQAVLEQEFGAGVDARAFATITAGGGTVTHVAAEAAAKVAVTTANGDRAVLRSHARPRAAAGRARGTVIVGHASGTSTGQKKRWGLFSDDDGFFFLLDGETLSVVRRSKVSGSVVDTAVANAQWSQDKNTIDVTRTHVYEIREAWPNSDALFFVDGVHVHTFSTDGAITGPAGVKARMPLSVEAKNDDAASAAGHFSVIACAVLVEEQARPHRTFAQHATNGAVSTSAVPLLAVRPKSTFGGVANLGELRADALTVMAGGDCLVQVVAGASVTGGSWDSVDAESLAEANTTMASITGGDVVRKFVLSGNLVAALDDVVRLLGDGTTQDTLVITAQRLGGSDISVRAALTWKETR